MTEQFFVPPTPAAHPHIEDRVMKVARTFAADIAGACLAARLAGLPMSECIKALRVTADMIERERIDHPLGT